MSQKFPAFRASEPAPYAQTTGMMTSRGHPMTGAINAAFEDAMAMRSRLKDEVFEVDGFSGRKFRAFLNNLMQEVPDPRYIEIGLFHGASFCSAVYRNRLTALGVDNWTEFNGTRDVFDRNLAAFKPAGADVTVVESDFRAVKYAAHGRFNILFYDGSHGEQDQYDGVAMPLSAMDDQYVLIIDDWNWLHVRSNTYTALKDAKVRVDYQIEVRTSFDGDLPVIHGRKSEWHNGCVVMALSKQ